jgi:DNA-directed RNA polymerase specialized sigma24 family protein
MDRDDRRLSGISTLWSVVVRARDGAPEEVAIARGLLLDRYGGAARRYLMGAVGDPEAAHELFQEFAQRFLGGAFVRHADPHLGRFRNYVKKALSHLVTDYRRAQQARPVPLDPNTPGPASDPGDLDADRDFVIHWRMTILDGTWRALRELKPTFFAVLHLRIEAPDLNSSQMAGLLTQRLGKPMGSDQVRKTLQRAREKFAHLLIEEVAQTFETPSDVALQEELRALDLLKYCRPALEQRSRAD